MNLKNALIALALVTMSTPSLANGDWRVSTAGNDWTRVESYVFAWATYRIVCQPSRRCEVGAGWKLFKKPRGERLVFHGSIEMLVIGAGCLYARPADGKGPVQVGVAMESSTNVSATVPW